MRTCFLWLSLPLLLTVACGGDAKSADTAADLTLTFTATETGSGTSTGTTSTTSTGTTSTTGTTSFETSAEYPSCGLNYAVPYCEALETYAPTCDAIDPVPDCETGILDCSDADVEAMREFSCCIEAAGGCDGSVDFDALLSCSDLWLSDISPACAGD